MPHPPVNRIFYGSIETFYCEGHEKEEAIILLKSAKAWLENSAVSNPVSEEHGTSTTFV